VAVPCPVSGGIRRGAAELITPAGAAGRVRPPDGGIGATR
jgi:hypothetical protein